MVQRIGYAIVLLLFLLSQAYADADYRHSASADRQPLYFVKIGAFMQPESAKKAALAADFPTRIFYLKRYYSLVTDPFHSKEAAKKRLRKIRKKFPDAYLIKLYQKETAHITTGKTPKKIALHETKTHLSPKEQPTHYQEALRYYRLQRYEDALALFDRVLIENPDHQQAAFYYAMTLYKLGFLDESQKLLIKLQKSLSDRAQQSRLQSYICKISKERNKHFFNLALTTGVGHNDNINLTTEEKYTFYGPYRLQNDTNKTATTYAVAALELLHRYKGLSFDLFNRFYSYNELLHSAKGNDLNYIDISTAYFKRYGDFSLLFPVGYNRIYFDHKIIAYNYYTHPRLTYALTKSFDTTLHANITDNHTKYDTQRDYRVLGGGMGIRYRTGGGRFKTFADINFKRYRKEDSGRVDISKNVTEYTIQAEYQLPQKLSVGANILYAQHRYIDLDSVLGYKREDDQTLYRLWLTKSLDAKASVNMTYQHTYNNSNINLYTYRKNNYTMEYKHTF